MATFFLVTPTNVGHETLGDIEKIIQAKVDPMAQLTHVTRKTGAMGTTPILMSRTNPDGIPLEDIIDQLIAEMNETWEQKLQKTEKIKQERYVKCKVFGK